MSRLNTTPRIIQADPVLIREFREHATQVNNLTEGKIAAVYNAATSFPTTGTQQVGDFVRNSAPSELGSPGSKYVVFGWLCVTAGTPGTFVQCRFLTGN